jgi:adenylate cyclase
MTPVALALAAVVLALLTGAAVWIIRLERDRSRLRERLTGVASDLQNLQLAFSRFAPDEVIERVIANGLLDVGEKKEVSVLFADLVGFTALSESVEPTTLVGILNGYFERMSRVITEHRGHVSTFIGDGILALFGALAPNPWQANDAANAAIAMQAEMRDYNRALERDGLPKLEVGIGLHRGTGVAGLVGSHELKEFAFVGRTVNVAARVQDLTRSHDAEIIVTEALRVTLDPRFHTRELPAANVKGVADSISIHALEGAEAD